MPSLDEQLNRATVRLCREADRALLDFMRASGEQPSGIDLNMLASRVALWDLEDVRGGGVIAWVAVVVVAWSSWRRKWKEAATYRRALAATWSSVMGLWRAIRLAFASDRHVVFEIESMIKMVS